MKKLIILLLTLILVVSAALADGHVIDDAQLFTQQETAVMDDLIEHIRDHYQVDVAILTTKELPRTFDDSVLTNYADTYYDEHGFGLGDDRTGMLVLLDMNNSYLHISTAGRMIDYMIDSRIDALLDEIMHYYKISFGTGCISLLHRACMDLQLGIPAGQYRYTAE